MNVEKLLRVIQALRDELDGKAIATTFSRLTDALTEHQNQQTAKSESAVESIWTDLRQRLRESPSNNFVPSLQAIHEWIGAERYTGFGLLSRIEGILSRSGSALALARADLQTLLGEVFKLRTAINQMAEASAHLNLKADQLEPGEFELGIRIPLSMGANLSQFQSELETLEKHLKTFAELTGEDLRSPLIRGLGSGSLEVFLGSGPLTAAAIVMAIERIVALYKTTLEIRLLKRQLAEKDLPQATIDSVSEHEIRGVNAQLAALETDLMDRYAGRDDGRRNEIKNAVTRAVRYLANRVDKGMEFEVTAPNSPSPRGADEADRRRLEEAALKAVQEKGSANRQLERSEERVLMLPEPTPPEEED